MDLQEFNSLSRITQAELAWEHGQFLARRTEYDCSVFLYHMSRFFAEVWYSPQANQPVLVHAFKSESLLDDYLGQINLDGLMR